MKKRFLLSIACGVFLSAVFLVTAQAQNLIVNGDFSTGDLSGWTITPVAPTTITYDALGDPSGSALLARNDSTNASNANYLYQIVPVTIGVQYKLDALWQGNLLNGGTGRNWAEVYVNFVATNTFDVGPTSNIFYKKATDGSNSTNPVTNLPYSQPWTWESILASPTTTASPMDGVFTATNNFIVIAFNLGGRAMSSNNTQPGYYYVDNVSLVALPEPTTWAMLGLAGLVVLVRFGWKRQPSCAS